MPFDNLFYYILVQIVLKICKSDCVFTCNATNISFTAFMPYNSSLDGSWCLIQDCLYAHDFRNEELEGTMGASIVMI